MTKNLLLLSLVSSMLGWGCGSGRRPVRPGSDGGTDSTVIVDGCDRTKDMDGDGIADAVEGNSDIDGDGTPNWLDDDSDGDGVSDRDEHGDADPCALIDTDSDGTPDWWDTDSDNDGLSDGDEVNVYRTDPRNIDTDGDGVTDLGEVLGSRTDPLDPTSTIPATDFFVVLPFGGPEVVKPLRFGTSISVADVYFLIDTTGSMGDPIANVTSSLTSISSEISTRIPDVQMGVGFHRDFPFGDPGGVFSGSAYYGASSDQPYKNEQDITADLSAVQSAFGRLSAGGGGDNPEAQVEALYQTATGEGANWSYSGSGGGNFNLPRRSCPSIPDEPAPRYGYPCFRRGALPIIILVSDVTWHNGPSGAEPYADISPTPHIFDQAVIALNTIGARFIGVAVNGGGRANMELMATQTGTVDGTGSPLVYDASGGTVSNSIIEGLTTLTGGVKQDVTTRTENVPGNPDEFDATQFIKAITPIEGYTAGVPGGYDSKDDIAFYGVVPGTQVEFDVRFFNDVRPAAAAAEIFQAKIIVVGNGVATLDSRNVYIIVPPDGGTILI
ncbi:MAG: hypothetical protein GXP55_14355 [Deltaproteobacteria bacterium]|nr:hypothetical protein [Deltaproteobacteria bacterium]